MADSINTPTTLDEVESLINQGIAEAQSNFTGEGDNSNVSSIFSQIQSSIQQGINEARSNSTGGEGDTSASSNSFAEFFATNLVGEDTSTSDSSNSSGATTEANATTQENLSQIGQQQVAANLGSDSLTNPSEGNSNGAYSFNFQDSDIKPIFDESTGQVSLEIDGQTVGLFNFNSGGSISSFGGGGSSGGGSFGGGSFGGGSFGGGSSSGGGSSNPFASGGSDGGNPLASSSSFGGGSGNPFGGGGSFGGGGFGGGGFGA